MKLIRNIALYGIFAVVMFSYTSCGKQKLFGKVTWEGYVYDHNGAPASGIHMTLKGCSASGDASETCKGSYGDFEIGSADTDASGHFKIQGKPARNGVYFAHVGNNGSIGWGVGESALKTTQYTQIHLP